MVGMWEHVDRLYSFNLVFAVQQIKITRLSGRVTAYIDNPFWTANTRLNEYIYVHTSAGRICNNYVGMTMF